MTSPLAKKIRQNFIAHTGFFARYDKAIKITHTKDYVKSNVGVNAGALNVNVPLIDEPTDELFNATLGYFTQIKQAAVVWLWDHLTNWQTYFTQHKVNLLGPNTGMYALTDNLRINGDMPQGLEITEVSSPQHTLDFGSVVSTAFGQSYETPAVMEYYHRLSQTTFYTSSALKMFVGYQNNKVVCCGTRLIHGNSAGIYSIATLPQNRGMGLGSAVFHHILQDIRQNHNGFCTLKASPKGMGIYRKAGFEPVCEVFIYDNRDRILGD